MNADNFNTVERWFSSQLARFISLLLLVVACWPAWAAIVLEGTATGINTAIPTDGSPGALTINKPAVAKPGMALIVSIAARPHGMDWTVPAGWTQLSIAAEQENGGTSTNPGGMTLKTFYRIVDVGEPNSYTWTFANTIGAADPPGGGSAVGGMLVYSGLDTSTSPLDATPSSRLNASGTTHRTTAITTATANATVVSIISYLSAYSLTYSGTLCGTVEHIDTRAPTSTNAVGTTLQMGSFTQATPGTTCAPQSSSGDSDTGIGHLMALKPSARDLTLSVVRGGPLSPGGAASYTMTITNAGSLSEPGPLTIVNTLPAGLTYTSFAGSGWSCGVAGQVVSCQKTGALAAGISATPLVINVSVAAGTSGVVTYTATGSGTGGDGNTVNNTATDSYVIATTPYAEYRMDETSWGTILDSSGNGRNATVLGTATATPTLPTPPGAAIPGTPGTCGSGKIPTGTGTNGVATGIDVNDLGNAGTIAFWYASSESWAGTNRILFDASNELGNGGADKHFYLVKDNIGRLVFALEDSADTDSTATSPSYNFAANTWHHVAVTWDLAADRLYIYLDGDTTPVATSSTNVNGTLGALATLYLGAQRFATIAGAPASYTNNTTNGYIDEVRLYTSALAPLEIADIADRTHSCGGVFIATPGAANEGNSGTSTLNFTVSLDTVKASSVTVNYATSNGTATGGASCSAGVDYVTTTGTLTIPAGSLTGTIPVTICGDTSFETNETFTVTLSSPSGVFLGVPSTATGTINNDDAQPTVNAVTAGSVSEGNAGTIMMPFTITLSGASYQDITVDYATSNGTATGGGTCSGSADFITTSGTLTILAGATSGTVNVPVCGDTSIEGDETFTLTLSAPDNATLGTATVGGTIIDDDYYCYTDNFTGSNGSAPSSDWRRTSSNGSFGLPVIYNNRLRLTDASNNVATAAHLQRMFPGAGNKIIVEFDYYAYNGTGADGIVLTFSDASITPNAGAYGGSLGYAQRTGVNGFSGGWLGLGIDEYGNFRNDSEGRGDGGSPTGLVADSVSVRGSGSLSSGYLIHRESGTLSPGIDQPGATAGPGHRYRITIDHSDGTHAYVKVERNTGGGYVTVIPQYDAKAESGQAAVPTNWLLSFTGSTGSSTNIHEIDTLQVCAFQPILPLGPDHYVISHSGTGLTCEAEPVTFTAHSAAHARTDAGGKTLSISTSTSSGAWVAAADSCTQTCYNSGGTEVACAGALVPTTGNNGQASYTFATGETGVRLCLRHNAATTVGINVSDGTATEATGTASAEASPGADPNLVFSNTGFRFYANGSVDALGNLVAGLRSDTVEVTLQPTPQTITIRALKSSETTPPRCVSLLGSASKTVKFAYQCIDPAACHPSSSGLEINGTAVTGSSGVPVPASNVSVTFNGSGSGTINLKYWDVGTIKLYAAASISDSVSGGIASIATGSSNTFLVKPYGFDVKACTGSTPCTTANTSAIDGTGSVFAKAGDAFRATVTAVAYGGTVTTPSFGLGTGNSTETVSLTRAATPVAPDPGAAGTLGGTTSILRSAFSDGVASVSDLTWSEAGVTTLTATNATFQTVASGASGTSGNIGRFTPHHFGVTGNVVTRSDMQLVEGQATPFTYMGEPMRLALVVTAFNKGETPTSNYKGSFAKLDAATLGANIANWTCTSGTQCMGLAAVSGSNLTNRLSLDLTSTNSAAPSNTAWNAGVSTFTLYAALNRATAPDGPYPNLKLSAKPLDSDGITIPPKGSSDANHCVNLDITAGGENALCTFAAAEAQLRRKLFETNVQVGRLRLLNFYGSELLQPRVEYRTEFWDGTRWMTNTLDNSSPLVAANLATGGLTVNNITGLSSGVGFITFNAAAAGSYDIAVNLNSAGTVTSCNAANPNGITPVNMEWLQALWSSNCNGIPAWQQDPNARIRLGTAKAPYIYLRERY